MNTPCPKKLTHYDFTLIEDDYHPRGRIELAPIFELAMEPELPPTPPPTPVKQKSYFGKKRLPKADI